MGRRGKWRGRERDGRREAVGGKPVREDKKKGGEGKGREGGVKDSRPRCF